MTNDVFTLDENNNAAIRTLGVKSGSAETNSPSVFTEDENGNAAVRVVGGGDSNNLGYFATLEALQEAYPTAEPGNWAIVGTTDTVWVWDEDTTAWVDTDQKGQVTSVNNQTGAVTIGINDILPDQTGHSGHVLGTDGFVAGWVVPEQVQRSAMPQASEDEEGNIYQFVGTTDATYTNGYFYKCVSDGGNPATYSWVQTNVQPAGSSLPDPTNKSGKGLVSDGSSIVWSTKNVLTNDVDANNTTGLNILGTNTGGNYCVGLGFGSSAASYSISVGYRANANSYGVSIGYHSTTASTPTYGGVEIGTNSRAPNYGLAIGFNTKANGSNSIQLGSATYYAHNEDAINSDANTMKVANRNGNFEIMSADGTIPTDRFTTTPVADGTYVPTLTISSGTATRSWAAPGGGSTGTTASLVVADWSSNTQTVNVTGVTASNNVIVAPAPASQADYTAAGIICTAQGAGTLTFTCTTVPSSAITVNVLII